MSGFGVVRAGYFAGSAASEEAGLGGRVAPAALAELRAYYGLAD